MLWRDRRDEQGRAPIASYPIGSRKKELDLDYIINFKKKYAK